MNLISTTGLVIKESPTGESDRIVTILTKDAGLIRAFAKGARRPKSKLYSGTALFCYSDFVIYQGKESSRVNEAAPINIFHGLRTDLEKLAVAEFLCELVIETAPENENSNEYMRIVLNSLYFLGSDEINPFVIKPFFQFRLLSLAGFKPDVVACKKCCTYETEKMAFDIDKKCIYCENCRKDNLLPLSVITAIRDILFSDLKTAIFYKTDNSNIPILNRLADGYLYSCTGRGFKTLKFLQSL